jgi:hypothetical protein
VPLLARAWSQANRAVRAPPTCKKPVGLGAKRVRMVSWFRSIQVKVYFAIESEVVQDKILRIKNPPRRRVSYSSIMSRRYFLSISNKYQFSRDNGSSTTSRCHRGHYIHTG